MRWIFIDVKISIIDKREKDFILIAHQKYCSSEIFYENSHLFSQIEFSII